MSADRDDKYFDPATNDFLPQPSIVPDADPDPDLAGLSPEARVVLEVVNLTTSIEDARAPFMTVEEMEKTAAGVPSPEDIAAAFPGQNEIVIGNLTLIKMASGNFTVNFRPLSELLPASLNIIREAVLGLRGR